jgi:hypothetical protein
VVVRPVYAPALVAFFAGASVRVAIGVPGVSWVALSWGEPLVPWWGKPQFIGRPTWAGWGGPRIVNNVVVNRTTVVNVTNINVYRNTSVEHAVVAVREDHFGRGAVQQARIAQIDTRRLEPARAPLRVAPDASSYVAASGRATRPPETTINRSVVATRAPRREGPRPPEPARAEKGRNEAQRGDGAQPANTAAAPPPRIVPAPKPASTGSVPARPTFGQSEVERQRPAQPRQFGAPQPEATPAPREANASRPAAGTPQPQRDARRPDDSAQRPDTSTRRPDTSAPRPATAPPSGPAPSAPREVARPAPSQPQQAPRPERVEAGRGPQQPQRLPGEPANRISPQRAERRPQPEAPQEKRGGGREQPPLPQPGR